MEILEGTFKPPKGTDPATVIILNEISRIWRLIGDGEVSIIITKEDFQHYWRRVKNAQGHRSWDVTLVTTQPRLTQTFSQRHTPDTWHSSLRQVQLQRGGPKAYRSCQRTIAGVAVITKVRTILLMEVEFNCHNRLLFGDRMMKLA